jgi:formate dehydrogenase major subunit
MTEETKVTEAGGISRRKFIKGAGLAAGGAAIGTTAVFAACGGEDVPPIIPAPTLKVIPLTKKIGETPVICTYCAVGCGLLATSEKVVEAGKTVMKMTNVEGDPDNPMNKGSMCQKTQALVEMGRDNPRRLSKVLYRAPGANDWEEKSWDWTLDTLARRIKDTRDATFEETNSQGQIVNRTDALCMFGGGNIGDADCQLVSRMNQSLGINRVDHNPRF